MSRIYKISMTDLNGNVSFGGCGGGGNGGGSGSCQKVAQCGLDIIDGAQKGAWAGGGIGAAVGTISPDPVTTAGGAAVGAGAGAVVGGIAGGVASDACNSIW